MDANAAKVTTYLDHANIVGYPDDYVQSTLKHPMDFVAGLLNERGWAKGTIGVEMDTYYFTAACYESLKRNLPGAAGLWCRVAIARDWRGKARSACPRGAGRPWGAFAQRSAAGSRRNREVPCGSPGSAACRRSSGKVPRLASGCSTIRPP